MKNTKTHTPSNCPYRMKDEHAFGCSKCMPIGGFEETKQELSKEQDTKQLREELEEILPVGLDDWLFEEIVSFVEQKLKAQKSQLIEEVRKIIGEDESTPEIIIKGSLDLVKKFTRNELRAKQRQKLSLLENARKN